MKPNPIHRLPAPLEAAVQRLKMAAREGAERTVESLGLAALAATTAAQRDILLEAQFELNRKSAIFALTFNDALDEHVLRELGSPGGPGSPAATAAASDWSKLSLVDDSEVEAQISAERFGMEISLSCEWDLRELTPYFSALLGDAGGERDSNPMRPELMGHAMLRGIDAVTERPDIRSLLSTELGRSLAGLLRQTYGQILADLHRAGVQPKGMSVRQRASRPGGGGPGGDGHSEPGAESAHGAFGRPGTERASSFGSSTHGGTVSHRGTHFGQVDPALMSLIRRLAFHGSAGGETGSGLQLSGHGDEAEASGLLPANLIHAHREELRQASHGALDHMVIDVIGFLFDQILADPKVPPQMARQIARLQLPVLRAALGDPSFFSSRRHPVRRFVNRIASLGTAFEDFGDEGARAFLEKVKALIHEVVEGDFEQIALYEQQLAALEAFTAELLRNDSPQDAAAATLLSEKEDQQRLRQLYAQRLEGELKDVPAPPFLRSFVSQVWSQVLLRAAEQGGADAPLAQRLRDVGRDLFVSVQPKATPAHRKAFLAQLPKLMQDLTEGMNLIAWPEEARRQFFGQLLPAHAEALKSPGGRQLETNLMAHQVEGALRKPLPSRDDLRLAHLPVLTDELPGPQLSADEARRVGLVPESSIDWDGKVDIDLSAEPDIDISLPMPALPGLPPAEPAEPSEGRALVEHLEIGFAYQMHFEGQWQKVRLSHVSPAHSFYIFTHGSRHRRTISLTLRMLTRLCETGRLKAFESAYLIERATLRARRQLAALSAASTTH